MSTRGWRRSGWRSPATRSPSPTTISRSRPGGVEAGLVSSLDSEQARAARAQTAASIPNIENSFTSATYRLAVLTGRAPGALTVELSAAKPIPHGPADVALGIPADTLRQRPDIRAAERGLAAATARIGVAEAQLLSGVEPARQYRHVGLFARRPL